MKRKGVGKRVRYEFDWDKVRSALEEEAREKRYSGLMLAQEIGITQSLYSMFMSGKRKSIGRDSLFKICEYFGVSHEHWYKKIPVGEEERILKQLELLLTAENISPERRGVLKLVKDQINELYKEIS